MDRSIMAYFRTSIEAGGALAKLQALRAVDARIDRLSLEPGVLPGGTPGLPEPVEPTALSGLSSGDLESGSWPEALTTSRGMTDRPQMNGASPGEPPSVLLTAIVNEAIHPQALRVVQEAGGIL